MPFNQGIESDASPHVGVIALKKTVRQMMCTSLRPALHHGHERLPFFVLTIEHRELHPIGVRERLVQGELTFTD